jgi:hypothetical protein
MGHDEKSEWQVKEVCQTCLNLMLDVLAIIVMAIP